jgi:hypothetical protein
MFIFGNRLYGKVDHVPGLFYIATEFGHYLFVPVVPLRSYLILDNGKEQAIPVPMSKKSIFVAWLSTVCFVGGTVAACVGAAGLEWARRGDDTTANTITLVLGLAVLAIGVASYWIFRAGRKRALVIAEQAGLDLAYVNAYFDRLEGRETPEFTTNSPILSRDQPLKRWNE